MSFKIVQTKEPGTKVPLLSIVPTAWEKDGTLYWPPTKKKGLIVKLIKDGNSRPEPDWIPQPCIRKRNNFLSYEAADLELTAMEQKSDSEAPHSHLDDVRPKKRLTVEKRKEIGRIPQADFNFLAEECKKTSEILFGNQSSGDVEPEMDTKNQVNVLQEVKGANQSVSQRGQSMVPAGSDSGKVKLLSMKVIKQRDTLLSSDENPAVPVHYSNFMPSAQMIDYEEDGEVTYEVEQSSGNEQIIANQSIIMQNQNALLENQMRIIEQLANQETMIQLICQQLSTTKIQSSISKCDNVDGSCDTADPLPIDSIEKLNQFEMDLRDETYMNKLIQSKSHICGVSGKMNGLNCSYRLIDYFFKRQLLVKFSWGGGSRKDESKMAFKTYSNIMTTFFKIINKADANYTEMECQNFFKCIIKNAKRRFEISENDETKKRSSSGKKRPHNLNYKVLKEDKTVDVASNIDEIPISKTDDQENGEGN